MKTIDSTFVDELKKGTIRPFYCLSFSFDSYSFYFTDCDVPLVVDSQSYESRGFSFDNIVFSNGKIVDSFDVTLDNVDRYLTTSFVDGTPTGGSAKVQLILLDLDYHIIEAGTYSDGLTLFDGIIDSWEMDDNNIKMVIVTEFNKWNKKTLNKQSASCRWKKFKGDECQYSGGETWCDRTWSRCSDLHNTANFGGERWLPSIMDKDIWWGRKPK